MSDNHHSTDHAAPAHSMTKKVLTIVFLALVPLAIVVSLITQYKARDGGTGASAMTEEAIEARIQKVGMVSLGSGKRELKTGEDVYKAQCSTCHAAGVVGAPKFGDAAAWGPRIKTGYEALLNSALKGKNNMTPQSGGAFSDYEVSRAVVYMANAGGAKFAEPAAPAGTAAPEAAAPAASAASAAQ
ncbi:c-type cytochrome [Rhodoferax sp.]|uniref:c-type cytochrome n=1 Tax=Rhodoferax sp. TaxID=50421 RepID=UPI00262041D1|nr:c-type cytochrome [Rhodoferax sp.]MDD2926252.1 c-type cytochrome [Rhodoferax sp.]